MTVAAVGGEPRLIQMERHERHMGRVHGLHGDPVGRGVKVHTLHEVLDGFDDFFENGALLQTSFEHLLIYRFGAKSQIILK